MPGKPAPGDDIILGARQRGTAHQPPADPDTQLLKTGTPYIFLETSMVSPDLGCGWVSNYWT
jgi:hypothetical protein